MKKGRKRGQITLFIILGIIIVGGIIGAFILIKKFNAAPQEKLDPKQYAEKCIKDAVDKSVMNVFSKGGVINPKFKVMYNNSEYNYLCYSKNTYEYCENLYPMLKSLTEEEVRKNSKTKIEGCFTSLKNEFQKEGYSITDSAISNYKIEFIPNSILIKIDKKITLIKNGQSSSIENFNIELNSPAYDLIEISRNIINGEAADCYYSYDLFMENYPRFSISRISYYEARIYEIKERISGMIFKFAVKSCDLKGEF